MEAMKAKWIGLALLSASLAVTSEADLIWDNDSSDGQWKTAVNWTGTAGDPDNMAPASGSSVRINNGDTVNWNGITGQVLPANLDITLAGNSTWTAEDVIRLNNASITVNSGSTLTSTSGGFWDLNNADITFENGAIVTIDDWENKGANTFTFNLGTTGFATLMPNNFRTNLANSDITDALYEVDLLNYAGAPGTITLVDYAVDGYPGGMDDSLFQTAGGLNVLNAGVYAGSHIQWNDSMESIELVLIPEPSTFSLLVLFGLFLLSACRRRI